MSVNIDELASDATISGTERIPISDNGTPKVINPNSLSAFVIDQIEAKSPGLSVTGSDGVFMLQSGVLQPVDVDLVAQHAIDTVWGKAAESSPGGTGVVPLKVGSTEKTVTLANLAAYVRSAIEAAILDVSDLGTAAALTGDQVMLVTQSGVGKKVTISTLAAYVQSAVSASILDVSSLSTAGSLADADVALVSQSGTAKKMTLATLAEYVRAEVEAAILDVSNLTAAGTLAGANVMPVTQSGVCYKVTLTDLAEFIRGAIEAAILDASNLTSAGALADADVLPVTQSATGKKVALSALAEYVRGKVEAAILDASDLSAAGALADADLLPVTQSATAKKVAISTLASYIQAEIGADVKTSALDLTDRDTAAALSGTHLMLVTQSGVGKKVELSTLATFIQTSIATALESAILDVSNLASAGALADADMLLVTQTTTGKKVTLSTFAEYVRAEIAATLESAILDLSDLSAAGALSDADVMLVTQGSTGKKVALSALATKILAGLDTYVAALSAVTTPADADVLYILQGGVEKKVTVAQLRSTMGGNVVGPSSTTEDKVPQWDSTTKTLKDGLAVVSAVRGDGSALDSALATEKAVRDLEKALVYTQTDIGADLADADEVPLYDVTAVAQRKSAVSRFWTYIWSKITGATAKTTPVDADGIAVIDSAASDAVKKVTLTNLWANLFAGKVTTAITGTKIDDLTAGDDNTDLNASTTKHGLAPKAVAPSSGILNVLGIANGETAFSNKTLYDATTPAALGTAAAGSSMSAARRDHVHDMPKLDDLAAADDNTDLDASASKHGLMPKADKVKLDALTYSQAELSADPSDPAEGKHIIWQSDGTGAGDDGDIMVKITAGGVTKTATLIDFSAIS